MTAADPIPEGYVTFPEIWEAFHKKIFHGQSLIDQLPPRPARCTNSELEAYLTVETEALSFRDEQQSIIIDALTEGLLEAFVRLPGSHENVRIVPATWKSTFWPTRPFLDGVIFDMSDGPWRQYHGRTPFVSRTAFNIWLEALSPSPIAASSKPSKEAKQAGISRATAAFDKFVSDYEHPPGSAGPFPSAKHDWQLMRAAAGFHLANNICKSIRKDVCGKHGYTSLDWLKTGPKAEE